MTDNLTHGPRAAKAATLALGALLALASCGNGDATTRLERAGAEVDNADIVVADEGATLIINGEGQESDGASIGDVVQVLIALDTPDRVVGQMENTRALDGMQEAEWDGLAATWTYHPDEGLDIIVGEA